MTMLPDPKADVFVKTTEEVRLDDLHVDPEAQRQLNVKRATKMADEWNELWAGSITVGVDPIDRKRYICDGQTRAAAAGMAGHETITATLFEPVDRQERARMFLHLNRDRKGVSLYDMFRVALVAGEPDEIQVQSILDERGLKVGPSSGPNTIGSIAALMGVYRKYGPDVLRSTLDAITSAWRTEGKDRWDGALLGGLAKLIALNLARIEYERLYEVMRKRLPTNWRAWIVSRSVGTGGSASRPNTACVLFAEVYNTGLRTASRKLKS
jgi:hypothetical protein